MKQDIKYIEKLVMGNGKKLKHYHINIRHGQTIIKQKENDIIIE